MKKFFLKNISKIYLKRCIKFGEARLKSLCTKADDSAVRQMISFKDQLEFNKQSVRFEIKLIIPGAINML